MGMDSQQNLYFASQIEIYLFNTSNGFRIFFCLKWILNKSKIIKQEILRLSKHQVLEDLMAMDNRQHLASLGEFILIQFPKIWLLLIKDIIQSEKWTNQVCIWIAVAKENHKVRLI